MKTSTRIGFNMWTHSTTHAGGMVYYALSMLREFCRMVPENLVLFYGAHGKDLVSTVKEIRGIRQIELKNPGELYDNRFLFDVLFSPTAWGGVNMLDRPTVHVIPDIQEKYYPEFFSDEERELRNTIVGHSARASTILITISNFSKKTIVEKFGVPDEQVQVTYLAAHPIFSDASSSGIRPSELPERLDRFLLYPANSWGHKNHKKLLDGLLTLRQQYDMEISCVFTGHMLTGQFHVDIIRQIRARGLEKQVYHLGTVGLAELKYLYLHAAALIHPSLFEGFGIPLVEAMSCGCPIVAADATSIPEIAGRAALYFDPNDPADIANKIYHFVHHPDEARERVAMGSALSRNFNDTRTAEETLSILEKAHRIAGITSLKAMAAGARAGQRDLLSMLFVFQESPAREMIREIEGLLEEFPNAIQMIAMAPEPLRDLLTEAFGGRIHITLLQGNCQEAVSRASRELEAEYVFLSDGKSVILPSFIYYLMAHEAGFRERGELLDGDWYVKAPGRKGLGDSPILPEKDEEKRKAYVCDNLSFVVRREAFRRVMREPSAGLDTLSGIASELWDQCSRARVYRVVDLRFVKDSCEQDYNLVIVTRKLKNRLVTKPWLRRLLDTRAGNRILAMMVQTYYRTPVSVQRRIVKAYKTIAAHEKW